MKKLISLTTVAWCLFLVSCMAASQSKTTPDQPKDAKTSDVYYVVEYNGYNGVITNEVLSAQEYGTVKSAVDAETPALVKEALKLAEQDWKESGSKSKSFPKDAIYPKKLKIIGKEYTDLTKANDKVTALNDKQKKKTDAENKVITDRQNTLKETDDQKAQDAKKKAEAEAVRNLARKFFEKRMTELLGKAGSGTNSVPAQAQAPAATPAK